MKWETTSVLQQILDLLFNPDPLVRWPSRIMCFVAALSYLLAWIDPEAAWFDWVVGFICGDFVSGVGIEYLF